MTKSAQKYLKFLIWPGLVLLTAGLVAGFIGGWTALPVALLVGGLLLCVVAIALGGYAVGEFWRSRSTQAGTNAVVATLSLLVILGLINFLGARYDQRLDLTEAQLFTLAPESQTVLENLEQPVEVFIFDAAPNPTDRQLLESYRRFNPALTYEYVDPRAEPQLARQFGVQTVGEVYLQAGDERLLVQRINPQERLSERELTNRLDRLGRDSEATIYFLSGHGEYKIDGTESGYSQAAFSLEEEGFTVKTLNLADTPDIPTDAAAIVVTASEQRAFQPLFDTERQRLEQYLKQGGSLLLLVDPQVTTGLEPLLDRWGAELDDRFIIDTSGGGQLVGLGPAAPLVTDYGSHPITDEFENGRSFYPLSRPVGIEPKSSVEATPLLLTNPQTYAEPITASGELQIDTEAPPDGPFSIGVAFSRAAEAGAAAPAADAAASTPGTAAAGSTDAELTETEPTEPTGAESAETEPAEPAEATPTDEEPAEPSATASTAEETDTSETVAPAAAAESAANAAETGAEIRSEEARLVVIGNASFATDGLFSQQLNGDVFLNSVSWLSQVDNPTLSIRPKAIVNRRIVMTVQQQVLVAVLALLVLPGLGILGAGVMWLRRR
ncbi:MAG: ABC transporter [Leptolyngbya sp. SIO4C1]|nr:ABC transporter [Leptolyngbya sp. SIO4C1]